MTIRFSYQALTAGRHEVGIAGDFTNWAIHYLQDFGGLYLINFELNPGRYHYKLIVDGMWIIDPANDLTEPDPFGGLNSLLVVEGTRKTLTWEELPGLISRLEGSSFISWFRSDPEHLELRFFWFPGLAGEIVLETGGASYPLFRLGKYCDREVWHTTIRTAQAFDFTIRIRYSEHLVWFGSSGLSQDPAATLSCDPQIFEIFQIPDWVKSSIIYQIFPDRFCNGNHANDQDFSEWYYSDSRTPPTPGEFLPVNREYYHLVDDWYDISGLTQSPYLEAGKPDWWSFYGGDIEGVRQKLDYLLDLGIDAIYFNPLWEAKSNHKYDSADYRKLDPHFATTAEMQGFVKLAHSKGIRIILDVAFNHTGESFWAFRDCVEKGKSSSYWNWYDWHKWPLPKPLPPEFKPKEYYQCWWGIKDMPDLNFDLSRTHPSENHIRDIRDAEPNAPLVDYILDSVQWWLSDIGIDGLRLDVPDEVPWWFWQLFRQKVKELKPDAWLVGEIWQDATQWISPRYFDSVMNYAYFKSPVLEFFVHRLISREEFVSRIEEGLAVYPEHAARAMMNLLGSHDTQRIMELAAGDMELIRMAVFFQMTFVGTPHIYYGDEIGMRGGKDPDNRRPFDWRWETRVRSVQVREFYRRMIALRRQYQVLVNGEFSFIPTQTDLVVYSRTDRNTKLLCLINPTDSMQNHDLDSDARVVFHTAEIDRNGLTISLPARTCVLIEQ